MKIRVWLLVLLNTTKILAILFVKNVLILASNATLFRLTAPTVI